MSKNDMIAIVIGAAIVLVIFITAIAFFLTKKNDSRHGDELLAQVLDTLWKIPFTILYLVKPAVELIYGFFYRLSIWINYLFGSDHYKKNREQRLVRQAVSTVLNNNSNLLNTYLNRKVAKTLTFLLQIISFITTYAGFTFFLGAVNSIAPLFMAITVQGGCFYLLNYSSSRKRTGAWKRYVLLGFLILTSTTTSYIGIFDSVVRPVERIENQYNDYVNVAKSVISDQIDEEYTVYIDYSQIEGALDIVQRICNDADHSIKTLSQQADSININKTFPSSWTDGDGNIHPYVVTAVDNEASNQIVSLQAEISYLQSHMEKLSTYLNSRPSTNEILAACERIIDDPTKRNDDGDADKKVWSDLKTALYECSVLYGKLYPNDANEAKDYFEKLKMDEAIGDAEGRKLLEALYLSEFEEVIDAREKNDLEGGSEDDTVLGLSVLDSSYAFINKLNEMVVSKDMVKAQEIRNTINKSIDKNYSRLLPLITIEENQKKLKDAYEESHVENTQIMPFRLPFTDKRIFGEAIFSFVTAFLVDFLALLIAFALINKQRSILYFKKVGDLRANREEMLEDCLMYICLNSIQIHHNASSRSEIQDQVVTKINDVMRKFMESIHPLYLSDELNAFGYITEEDIVNFSPDEKRLFFTLSNAAQIHPCHCSEIIKIINADLDEYREGSAEPGADENLIKKYEDIFEKDKIFYLVSKNLHVWFCENFAELLQNTLSFDFCDNIKDDVPSSNIENPQMNGGEQSE